MMFESQMRRLSPRENREYESAAVSAVRPLKYSHSAQEAENSGVSGTG